MRRTPAVFACLAAFGLIGSAPAAEGPEYVKDVKPIFAKRCYACHGALAQKGDLRLDTVAAMLKGGKGGPAIEPGKSAESYLIDALEGNAGFRMPPQDEGGPLTSSEMAAIRGWIDAGAKAPADDAPQPDPKRHWAFLAPRRPSVPAIKNAAWVRNPIDAFLAAEHEKRGLQPVAPAERAELLRRVSLDLTGLAPTPEELRAFLADPSDTAYERAVDRLLDSPQRGERWARHWMDVWRYSDWYGFGAEIRNSRPHMWRWRDWVVDSLNTDKPYDRMVVEMIAGDEAAPDDPNVLRATGYLARNWYKFNRNVWLQDTVDHTAKAFLGLTLNCARCHDHKYDPIAQTDWYRMRAVFEPHEVREERVPGQADVTKDGVARVYDANAAAATFLFRRGDEHNPEKEKPLAPGLPGLFGSALAVVPVELPPTAYYPGLRPHVRAEMQAAAEAAVTAAQAALNAARAAYDAARAAKVVADATGAATVSEIAVREADVANAERSLIAAIAERESLRLRIAADDAKFSRPPDSKASDIAGIMASKAERLATLRRAEHALGVAERTLAAARSAGKPAAEIAGAETALNNAKTAADAAAKGLAGKLTAAYSPLTPVYPTTSSGRRLALARWIVDRGNPLTARVAVNHVWMRHFGEPLVPTVFDFGTNGKPPSNPALLDWLAVEFMESGWSLRHLQRLMVTSATYRMRSSGSQADPNLAIDPRNIYLWRMNPRRMEAELVRDNVLHVAGELDTSMGGPELDPAAGLTSRRRSLYFRHAPEKQMTFLKLFDAANTVACYRRDQSIVPQQALALANSPLALGEARLLARRLDAAAELPDDRFIAAAFERVLGREPNPDERAACAEYLVEQAKLLSEPTKLSKFGEGPEAAVPPAAEPRRRARETLVHVLMNHNDFVTVR